MRDTHTVVSSVLPNSSLRTDVGTVGSTFLVAGPTGGRSAFSSPAIGVRCGLSWSRLPTSLRPNLPSTRAAAAVRPSWAIPPATGDLSAAADSERASDDALPVRLQRKRIRDEPLAPELNRGSDGKTGLSAESPAICDASGFSDADLDGPRTSTGISGGSSGGMARTPFAIAASTPNEALRPSSASATSMGVSGLPLKPAGSASTAARDTAAPSSSPLPPSPSAESSASADGVVPATSASSASPIGVSPPSGVSCGVDDATAPLPSALPLGVAPARLVLPLRGDTPTPPPP
mmetsp:Transcript_3833/g.14231  ORF Transcript_3833/g.14231 Transcript_3833/m.14231 type:complete len:291 (-) Transcript_3833:1762-2634(-)